MMNDLSIEVYPFDLQGTLWQSKVWMEVKSNGHTVRGPFPMESTAKALSFGRTLAVKYHSVREAARARALVIG